MQQNRLSFDWIKRHGLIDNTPWANSEGQIIPVNGQITSHSISDSWQSGRHLKSGRYESCQTL